MKTASFKILIILSVCWLLNSCALEVLNKPFTGERVESYAQERYQIGIEYMEQSRFELASQQFAIASNSAKTPELKALAAEGYNKANNIIAGRR
jgi:hypothetical protein